MQKKIRKRLVKYLTCNILKYQPKQRILKMRKIINQLKKEIKDCGIEIDIEVSKIGGEYQVYNFGKLLAEGESVTECRIYALEEILEDYNEKLAIKEYEIENGLR